MPERRKEPIVFIVDDDNDVREGLKALMDSVNTRCEVFRSTGEFLQRAPTEQPSCLILDVRLPGASGLDLQHELAAAQINIPIIFISGHGDIPMTVKTMKAGAVAFLTKPVHEQELLDSINIALERDVVRRKKECVVNELRARYDMLSPREREVMAMVTSGLMNKQTAAKIGLSEVTVKVHRHNMMKKLGAKSLPELVRIADMLGVEYKK